MGLADLHIHTIYSYDGTATVPAVLRRAKEIGLDIIAITDHDEIAGALEAVKLASHYGVEVIPGIEITTAEGDLLALFITEKVDAGLSLIETVLKVRELGGALALAKNDDINSGLDFIEKPRREGKLKTLHKPGINDKTNWLPMTRGMAYRTGARHKCRTEKHCPHNDNNSYTLAFSTRLFVKGLI
ncbi:MAG: PHP domain-containing protein [Anaerolineales bacterium]|nr:PHP domain-containing protein [Anaerolineales bacterium]